MYCNSTKIITLVLQILLGRVASTNRSFRRNDKLSKIQIPNMQHLHTMMNIEQTAVVTHRILYLDYTSFARLSNIRRSDFACIIWLCLYVQNTTAAIWVLTLMKVHHVLNSNRPILSLYDDLSINFNIALN